MVGFLRHCLILSADELWQLLTRRRAIAAFLLYLLFIGLVIYGFRSVDASLTEFLEGRGIERPETSKLLERLGEVWQYEAVRPILAWPLSILLFQFFAALWITELIALVSCDLVSRDRERGTLRFLFLRTTRLAYFLSKFGAHFVLFFVVHLLSLVALSSALVFSNESVTLQDCVEPVWRYWWSLAPIVALGVSLTLFASSLSKSVVAGLIKVHLLWLAVFFLFVYDLHDYLSWKSFAGIVVPFAELGTANMVGIGLLAAGFLLAGAALFEGAEV